MLTPAHSMLLRLGYSTAMLLAYGRKIHTSLGVEIQHTDTWAPRYSTMDNIDGKQARRTGTSSGLGELFEYVRASASIRDSALI